MPNLLASFALYRIEFSPIKFFTSSTTLEKCEAAILKFSPPAIITSGKVMKTRFDAHLDQSECVHLYNYPSNYTKKRDKYCLGWS